LRELPGCCASLLVAKLRKRTGFDRQNPLKIPEGDKFFRRGQVIWGWITRHSRRASVAQWLSRASASLLEWSPSRIVKELVVTRRQRSDWACAGASRKHWRSQWHPSRMAIGVRAFISGYLEYRSPQNWPPCEKLSAFSQAELPEGRMIRAKTERTMRNETLAKFVCHNLCTLAAAIPEFGVDSTFTTVSTTPLSVAR
jgi:hypothetical protein